MNTIFKKNSLLFTTMIIILGIFLLSIPSQLFAMDCTDYAYKMREDLAKCRPLGDAKDWATNAEEVGFPVDNIPRVGDIAVFQPNVHDSNSVYGHVAYVEKVENDNLFYVSERNFEGGGTSDKPRRIEKDSSDQFIHRKGEITSELKLDTESSQTADQPATSTEKNFFGVIGDWFKNLWSNIIDIFTVEAAETPSDKSATIAADQESQSEIQGSAATEAVTTIPPPSKPSLTSPYNWYQSLGGAPTLIWKGDENSISYYVVVNSSNTGDIKSGWINLTSWKPNLPNENYIYSWKVKAKNIQGIESSWSDESHFSTASTTLKFEGNISFSPPSPSSADQIKIFASTTGWGGVGVTLRVSVNTAPDGSSNGEWRILKELGVPKFNEVDAPEWNTKGWPNGTYRIRVEAKGPDDPNWRNPAIIEATYILVNKPKEQTEAESVQSEEFNSCIILDEKYCNKGELIYDKNIYPGYGNGFIGLGFTLPEGTKIYSPFKGLAEENVGIIVFSGSGLYGFDILDASDPEWGWKHQRDYLFVGGGVRTIIELGPMFTENPIEKGQAIAEVTRNQKIITPDGKEYDIAITFMHYDADSNIWSYSEELLNKFFHYQ